MINLLINLCISIIFLCISIVKSVIEIAASFAVRCLVCERVRRRLMVSVSEVNGVDIGGNISYLRRNKLSEKRSVTDFALWKGRWILVGQSLGQRTSRMAECSVMVSAKCLTL